MDVLQILWIITPNCDILQIVMIWKTLIFGKVHNSEILAFQYSYLLARS